MFIPLAYQIWKTLMTKESVSSKYRVEPESKKRNVNDVLDWLSIVRHITPSFWRVSYNLHAPLWIDLRKGRGNFLNLLQKERVPRKGEFPQKRGGRGIPILEETLLAPLVLWILQSLLKNNFFIEYLQK